MRLVLVTLSMEELLDIEQVISTLEMGIVSSYRDKSIICGTIQFRKNTTDEKEMRIKCIDGRSVDLPIPKGIGMNDLIRYIYYRLHQLFTIALLGKIRNFQMSLNYPDKTDAEIKYTLTE